MDYQTFSHSAFVAQGHAGEFTAAKPATRKEVFRKILGLERYEEWCKAAGDNRRDRQRDLEQLERNLEGARTELEQLPLVEARIGELTEEDARLAREVERLEETAAQLRAAANAYERLQRAATEADGRRVRVDGELARTREQCAKAAADMAAVERSLGRRDEVAAGYATLLRLRVENEEHVVRRDAADAAERAIATAERLIGEARVRLESQLQHADEQLAEFETASAGMARLEAEEQQIAAERTRVEELEERIAECYLVANDMAARAAAATAEMAMLKAQATELKDKESQLQGAARCPVCRQPLTDADVARIAEEYAAERRALGQRHADQKTEAAEANEQAKTAATAAERARLDAAKLRADLDARGKRLHAELAAARDACARLPALRASQQAIAASLANGDFAKEPSKDLAEARRRLAAIAYDAEGHRTLRKAIDGLAPLEREHQDLLVAEERRTNLLETACALGERERVLAAQLQEATAAATAARAELEAAEDVSPRLRAAAEDLALARSSQATVQRELGGCAERRSQLKQLEARVAAAVDESAALRDEVGVYEELFKAFGRDGVQAMLIDQSLPRVNFVANQMLDLMTGGRIHLQLKSKKERASGKAVESLDIRISDEAGTRDYGMYSGGEAFRVDFALRIALARLLAERAGAELPTLLIDEGFGTQDAEGIDRLVEAIQAVSREFKLILVVTHVEALRDRFDRRIEVSKDPQRGSFARVV